MAKRPDRQSSPLVACPFSLSKSMALNLVSLKWVSWQLANPDYLVVRHRLEFPKLQGWGLGITR